ncbi:MATE family efflux transporter [Clostridium sp.]|uniref:MATE family efflux transporter n=1 Tax=Clostridium sp. TaxID=1506 RepID=UPI002FC6B81B
MDKNLLNRRTFIKTLLSLALPITLQNLISSSLNMVDTLMIGSLGEVEIAAVGLANQFFFLYSLITFGINSGCAIFIAQFWGKKDEKNIRRVLGLCISTGIITSIFFTLSALLAPELIMKFFTKDTEVIALGKDYLTHVSFSYVLTSISFAYVFASRSIGQPKIPMITSATALICNTVLNYLLIFGKFGFPELGVKGAAIATLISRILELILIVTIIYKQKGVLAAKLHEMLDLSREFIFNIFKTIYPVILNEFIWSLGMTMYSVAYARISTDAVASVQISNTVQNIFMVTAFGLANACAIMIGNEIGRKNEDNAVILGRRFIKTSLSLGIILGISVFLFSGFIVSLFNVDANVIKNTTIILKLFSFIIPVKMLTALFIVGIFRSGGDTKFSLGLEMGSVWGIGVPLAFLGAIVLKLPIYMVVGMVYIEEIVKLSISLPRFKSKKWIRNLVNNL